jgi:cytochrome P450
MTAQSLFVVSCFVLAGAAYTLVVYVVLKLARRDEPKWQRKSQYKKIGKTIGGSRVPGPKPLPFIGNVHHLTSPFHIALGQMAEQYGPIFQIHFGSRPWIVLTDARTAQDLIVNRESTYPSRPVNGFFADVHAGESLDLGIYDRRWRTARALLEQAMLVSAIEKRYGPAIQSAAEKFTSCLHNAFAKPVNPTDDLRRCVMAAYLCIAYGDVASHVTDRLDAIIDSCWPTARRHFLDSIPSLRCLPLIERAVDLKAAHARQQFEKLSYELVDDAIEHGPDSCVAAKVLSSLGSKHCSNSGDLDGHNLASVSIAMLFETAAAIIAQLRWILAMLSYLPHIRQQILTELHEVVGVGRLPESRHLQDLHYLRASIKECIRMRPASFIIPHIAVRDDVYNGHLVPAGSVVLINTNPIHYDRQLFPTPKRFMPERYLKEDGTVRKSNGEREPWKPWGYSSSTSALHDVAERTLLAFTASVLALFDVERGIDAATGQPNEIDMDGKQCGLELSAPQYRLRFVRRRDIDMDKTVQQTQ